MERTFSYREAVNMVCAVGKSYVPVAEIREYFKNYTEDKQFTGDELKKIVSELVTGRERITKKMNEIGWKYTSSFPNRKPRDKRENKEER